MFRPNRLVCSKDALASNWKWLRDHSGTAAGAAVKADGYGLGALAVTEILTDVGCRDFFVSTWWEAEQVERVTPPDGLAVLHGVQEPDIPAALASNARPVLNSIEQIALWKSAAPGRACDVMVDTGMNRLGLRPDEIAALDGLSIHTLHSHLACADEDHPLNSRQLERFREVAAVIEAQRYSLANSAGILLDQEYGFHLVRPGLALYGGIPRSEARVHIKPVASLEASVVQRRTIREGESCGYGATFVATRNTEAAIVNIGYADGYWRGFSGAGLAEFNHAELKVLGRVSMDLVALDCSGVPELREGDWVSLDFELERASRTSGMSQYELLTGLGSRFERVWR